MSLLLLFNQPAPAIGSLSATPSHPFSNLTLAGTGIVLPGEPPNTGFIVNLGRLMIRHG